MSDDDGLGPGATTEEAPPAPESKVPEWAKDLDDDTRKWVEQKGIKSPGDLVTSYRNAEQELGRRQQQYAELLDAMVDAEEFVPPAAAAPQQQGDVDPYSMDPRALAQQVTAALQQGSASPEEVIGWLLGEYLPGVTKRQQEAFLDQYLRPVYEADLSSALETTVAGLVETLGQETYNEIAHRVLPQMKDPRVAEDPDMVERVFMSEYAKLQLTQNRQEQARRRSEQETLQDTIMPRRVSKTAADAIIARIENAAPHISDGL